MKEDPGRAAPSWRRKTEDERQRDLRRLRVASTSPTQPLFLGAAGASAGFLVGVLISVQVNGGRQGLLVGLSVALAVLFAAVGAVMGRVLGPLSWLSPPPPRLRMGICNRCFRLTLDGTLDRCACGGTFEDADGWTLNRCPDCGYDLRGTPERCPECGRVLRFYIATEDAAPRTIPVPPSDTVQPGPSSGGEKEE